MNSGQRQMIYLHGLCWEATHFLDTLPFLKPLVALVGQDEVTRLQGEAQIARDLTGGVKSYFDGDDQDTVTVLMLRLLADPDRTGRLVRAYRIVMDEGLDTVGVDVRDTNRYPSNEWLTPDEGRSPSPG
jgi:hypothetical protein